MKFYIEWNLQNEKNWCRALWSLHWLLLFPYRPTFFLAPPKKLGWASYFLKNSLVFTSCVIRFLKLLRQWIKIICYLILSLWKLSQSRNSGFLWPCSRLYFFSLALSIGWAFALLSFIYFKHMLMKHLAFWSLSA